MEVRSYREVTIAPTEVAALFDLTGAPASTGELQWVAPSGWSELSGDGFRLARFGLPNGGETTIVTLDGSAGGAEANVRRWLSQLGLEPSAGRVSEVIANALQLRASLEFTVFDFAPYTLGPKATSFLVAIAYVGDMTVFVKAEAAVEELRAQREPFLALLQSLSTE